MFIHVDYRKLTAKTRNKLGRKELGYRKTGGRLDFFPSFFSKTEIHQSDTFRWLGQLVADNGTLNLQGVGHLSWPTWKAWQLRRNLHERTTNIRSAVIITRRSGGL
jgi:hypothetical protein